MMRARLGAHAAPRLCMQAIPRHPSLLSGLAVASGKPPDPTSRVVGRLQLPPVTLLPVHA